ncbi:Cytochrome b561 and DOMON domain-containing protein [Parasponia andersonii]|uniref:Cytochrome b561 and DOMON domain-containing protein n=1 Tax=Parasponia andersonii TaxID=3476 RepID=A0A2P5BTP4_PARAD|nr:Cytochrome b561 and DOMON domain-containing protein [Parasponia andersonii]
MTSYNSCLIVFMIYLRSITAQHSSLITIGDEIHVWKASKSININMEDMETKLLAYSSANDHHDQTKEDTEVTTNLRSWRGQRNRHHRPLRTAYGILNIIGWGTLLPVGAIIARYFSKFPILWNEWYSFHILCQSTGYVLGTTGWLIRILVGNSSKQHTEHKSHRILGIIIFTLTTIQMLAILWQPKKEEERCRKSWEIYHHLLGYVLIALIIADTFEGTNHQHQATKWKWTYVGILVVLALTALSLEIFRWVKSKKIHRTVELNSEMYTSP